ncbi:AraC family transcriptional regulator [uncultured Dokdonia sp.]|uniref:AraC family transcriptional regulator n=1 Tax=uncultured Dokdonia sp. TaxID=575653 RepID=UPI00260A37BA|nr:AraC family transcriptional regulator [uncultured Dokdonia sp.]
MSYQLEKGCYTGIIKKSLQTENVFISSTRFTTNQNEGGLHSHKNPIITFIYQGGDIEFREKKSYERKAGEFFFYPSNQPHKTEFRKEFSQNLNIEFEEFSFLKDYLTSSQILSSINNIDAKFLALKLLQELHINDSLSSNSIDLLVFDLISSSLKNQNIHKPKWIETLFELLNDRWQEQISLYELSIIIGVHPVTISKQFRKYFNCTYGEYMRKLKVKNSIDLIKNSNLPLIDIAYHCGFADQSHFSRNFKQFTGFLPSEFRNL